MLSFNLYDLHSDLLTSSLTLRQKQNAIKKIKKQGNRSINAIYNDNLSWNQASILADEFSKNGDTLLAFENCCYPDFNKHLFGSDFSSESKIKELANSLLKFNPLYLSLCWNNQNAFASGCATSGGITSAGRKFIEQINGLGGILDTAHINEQGFYELIDLGERVICSHTAFNFIFPHRRNISEHQIRLILQKGGIVGLVAVGHFLTGAKGSISAYENAFYEHIDGYLQKFGDCGLAIATDFYGSDAPVFLNGDYSFVSAIANKLLSRGISEASVKNILYKNASDFFEEKLSKV